MVYYVRTCVLNQHLGPGVSGATYVVQLVLRSCFTLDVFHVMYTECWLIYVV